MTNLERAMELRNEIIADRRRLHSMPETGYRLKDTTEFVKSRLEEMGYHPEEICESGLTVTLGRPGKTILLRADMDALPVIEDSGLDFASDNGNAHACGHDLHTAMLLGAAKLLKEKEEELEGSVKLMFQPAEETLWGARAMIEAGLLEKPDVDAAFAMHVLSDPGLKNKTIYYRTGALTSSCNGFKITIEGKGCHGALPETGIDPITIGSHLVLALQELIAREISFRSESVLTIGSFQAGAASNVIPQTAVLQGTLRTFDEESRAYILGRLKEISRSVASVFRGRAEVEILTDVPSSINDESFTMETVEYIKGMRIEGYEIREGDKIAASEDFSLVSRRVPANMIFIGAYKDTDGVVYPQHHPKVVYDEDVLPVGAAVYAECAQNYLKNNK